MPHLDVKYKPGTIMLEDLDAILDRLREIVADHYGEKLPFISAEVNMQGPASRQRRDVEIEVKTAPDPSGLRKTLASQLGAALAAAVAKHLNRRIGSFKFEVGVWITIFDSAAYSAASHDSP